MAVVDRSGSDPKTSWRHTAATPAKINVIRIVQHSWDARGVSGNAALGFAYEEVQIIWGHIVLSAATGIYIGYRRRISRGGCVVWSGW